MRETGRGTRGTRERNRPKNRRPGNEPRALKYSKYKEQTTKGDIKMEQQSVITNEMAAAVIADKCRQDKGLADRLCRDSREALESISGTVSDDVEISVARNTPDLVHVVLPDYKVQKDISANRLSDEDMRQISGGEIFITTLICVALPLTVGIAGSMALVTAAATGEFDRQ